MFPIPTFLYFIICKIPFVRGPLVDARNDVVFAERTVLVHWPIVLNFVGRMIIVFVGIFAAAYFGIKALPTADSPVRHASAIEDLGFSESSSSIPIELAGSNFDEFLNRSNSRILMQYSQRLNLATATELPVLFDHVEKKTRIAHRLIELNENANAVDYANYSLLNSSVFGVSGAIANNLTDDQQLKDLESLGKNHIDNKNPAISSLAHVAVTLSSVGRFLATNQAHENFRATAARDFDSAMQKAIQTKHVESVGHLKKFVTLIAAVGRDDDFAPFLAIFVEACKKAKTKDFVEFADRLTEELGDRKGRFGEIGEMVGASRDNDVESLRIQLAKIAEDPNTNLAEFASSVRSLEELLVFGKTKSAIEIAETILDRDTASSNVTLANQLRSIIKRANVKGKTIDLSSIRSYLDGTPVVPKDVDLVLFLVSPKNYSESVLFFSNQIYEVSRNPSSAARVEFAMVYVDNHFDIDLETENAVKRDMQKLAKSKIHWEIWSIDGGSEAGKQFLDNLAIETTPMVLVLEENRSVKYFGPSPRAVAEAALSK